MGRWPSDRGGCRARRPVQSLRFSREKQRRVTRCRRVWKHYRQTDSFVNDRGTQKPASIVVVGCADTHLFCAVCRKLKAALVFLMFMLLLVVWWSSLIVSLLFAHCHVASRHAEERRSNSVCIKASGRKTRHTHGNMSTTSPQCLFLPGLGEGRLPLPSQWLKLEQNKRTERWRRTYFDDRSSWRSSWMRVMKARFWNTCSRKRAKRQSLSYAW